MGWLFGKKSNRFEIGSENRRYVKDNLLWLFRHAYDADTFRFQLRLPTKQEFPDFASDPKENLICLVDKISADIGLEMVVNISVFNAKTYEWEMWRQGTSHNGNPPLTLQVREELIKHKAHLISAMVLDLSAIKLAPLFEPDGEPQSEMEYHAAMCGYSIVMLCAYTKINAGIFTHPWLDATLHLYETSLMCRMFNVDHSVCKPHLDDDAYEFLDRYVKEHERSDEFLEFKRRALRLMQLAPDFKIAFSGKYHLPEVADAYTKLIAEEKNVVYYNNRGYHYLLNGKYREAIADFNAAVDVDPYYAFAFNNRAYCRMFLGDMKGAWNDLEVSETFDGQNSFSHRNRGIYFLLNEKPEEALKHLQTAHEMDRKTEHIHYWLGKAYFAMSKLEEAKKHFDHSRSIPELPEPEYPM